MDFGHLEDLRAVSFALPPLPPRSRRVLAAHAGEARRPDWLRAGAPAWARKDWLDRLYPRGTADRDLLRVYSQRLGAIELNASYYRVPSPAMLDAWAAETPADFHFCPKIHKDITHQGSLRDAIPAALDFARVFLRLGPRLGPAFMQLPPWLGIDAMPALADLLHALPADFRLAVELRHPSWFRRGALLDEAADLLERRGVSAVVTDVAGRRDVCHATITAPFVIVRFVGNGLHPSDLPRADAWLDRLVQWHDQGLGAAYFFAHQPDDAFAPETLDHFAARARARGIALPAVFPAARQLDLFGNATPQPATTPSPGRKSTSAPNGSPPRR